MRALSFIAVIGLSIASCKHPGKSNFILIPELKDSVVLQIKDEESIHSTSTYVTNYYGEEVMLFWNWKENRALLYKITGIDKGRFIDPVELNKTIKLLEIDYSFCYYNQDTILGISPNMDAVYCFNINGVIKKKWYLKQDKIKLWGMIRLTCGQFNDIGYFDEGNKLFYLSNCFNPQGKSITDFFSHNHFTAIDLSKDTARVAFTFGQFPASYSRDQYQGNSCSERNIAFYAGKMLLNFYNSDSIYQYSPGLPDGQEYIGHNASDDNFITGNSKFDTTRESDRDYIFEYSMANERYAQLYSRDNGNYLYRVVDKKYRFYNEDSTFNLPLIRPRDIIVMNKDIHIIGALHFPKVTYNIKYFTPYKNGFWIASLADYRKFYYYEIKRP
jgi:hypothetical protein